MKNKIIGIIVIATIALALVGCQKKDTGVLTTVGDNNVNNTDDKEKYNADGSELNVVQGEDTTDSSTTEAKAEVKQRVVSIEKNWHNDDYTIFFKDGKYYWNNKNDELKRSGEYESSSSSITIKYLEQTSEYEGYETETYYVDDNGERVDEYTENEFHQVIDSNGNKLHKVTKDVNTTGDDNYVPEVQEKTETYSIKELTEDSLILADSKGKTIELKTYE